MSSEHAHIPWTYRSCPPWSACSLHCHCHFWDETRQAINSRRGWGHSASHLAVIHLTHLCWIDLTYIYIYTHINKGSHIFWDPRKPRRVLLLLWWGIHLSAMFKLSSTQNGWCVVMLWLGWNQQCAEELSYNSICSCLLASLRFVLQCRENQVACFVKTGGNTEPHRKTL